MTITTAQSRLLSPRQVAEILGVSVNTLSQWRHHKRYPLRYIKLGKRKVMYRPADVEAFIASRASR